MKTHGAIVAAIALFGVLSLAHAQPETNLEASASAHFDKGLELYREGSLDAALVEFERAYALVPNYRLLYNLAQIQAERHQYVAAVDLFEKYLATGGVEIDGARRSEVQHDSEKLRARIAYLTVDSNVEGARLFVDDVPVATLPLSAAVPINSGVCDVRLERAGYLPASSQLKVAGGEEPRLTLPLVAAGQAEKREQKASRAHSVSYLPFWISSATTLALASTTLALGLSTRSANRELDHALAQVPVNAAQVDDARAHVKLLAALTDTFAVASLAGLGVSLYLLLAPPRARAAKQESARAFHLSPSTRGLGLRASF